MSTHRIHVLCMSPERALNQRLMQSGWRSLLVPWQVTLSMMHRHHGGPVLGCSLRPGWKGDNIYTRFTPAGRPHTIYPLGPQCRNAMTRLCHGGELMYEGMGITWNVDSQKKHDLRAAVRPVPAG